ncbi:MAG: hypothetical protein AB7G15_14150 [Alphaproteobacteria bacterium]
MAASAVVGGALSEALLPMGNSAVKITGEFGVEARLFPQSPVNRGQGQNPQGLSVYGLLDFSYEDPYLGRLTFKPFYRADFADDSRSHFDVREMLWMKNFDFVEVRFGVGKVYWGVTESVHLVDIINQTDLVEDIDGKTKLGQPMLQLRFARDWGVVDLFYLPYFRERTFPGRAGRLRGPFYVATDRTTYESDLKEWHPDFAVRYSHSIGKFDFGVYYFRGTSRDPSFKLSVNESFETIFTPHYQIINQGGVDAQYTWGNWLFKFEGLVREGFSNRNGKDETYGAFVGGVEYTFNSVFGRRWDIGLLAEVLYDSRGKRATTANENDIFFGARLALNDPEDTRALIGIVQDLRQSSRYIYLESSRRIGDNWRIQAIARVFVTPARDDILYPVRKDSYIQLGVAYRF